ncbi:MAG: head GIN domain-containing protein [Steroidobacteraceae bacterium]
MKRLTRTVFSTLLLPAAASAASRNYELPRFEAVSVAAGISADIHMGASQSVVAESKSGDFDDLRVTVEGKVLRIDRPQRGWFSFGGQRTAYQIHVVTPTLHSLRASSGADARLEGEVAGDFSAEASSGADIRVAHLKGDNVKLEASSSGDITIAGSCASLAVAASSGADIEAAGLQCAKVTVDASSGSDISVAATSSVAGSASSGADVRVTGAPAVVQVSRSAGADVRVK